jgi:hypothetical protein
MNNNSEPAFPTTSKHHEKYMDGTKATPGMSLRDYFAAKAMQIILHNAYNTTVSSDHISKMAYEQADSMLKARG